MSGCGLYDAWIDSKILGEVAAQKVLAGKEYSKGMKVHKLSAQVLWKILIPEFMEFLNQRDPNLAKSVEDSIKQYETKETSDIDLMILFNTEEWINHLSQFIEQKSEICELHFLVELYGNGIYITNVHKSTARWQMESIYFSFQKDDSIYV